MLKKTLIALAVATLGTALVTTDVSARGGFRGGGGGMRAAGFHGGGFAGRGFAGRVHKGAGATR